MEIFYNMYTDSQNYRSLSKHNPNKLRFIIQKTKEYKSFHLINVLKVLKNLIRYEYSCLCMEYMVRQKYEKNQYMINLFY